MIHPVHSAFSQIGGEDLTATSQTSQASQSTTTQNTQSLSNQNTNTSTTTANTNTENQETKTAQAVQSALESKVDEIAAPTTNIFVNFKDSGVYFFENAFGFLKKIIGDNLFSILCCCICALILAFTAKCHTGQSLPISRKIIHFLLALCFCPIYIVMRFYSFASQCAEQAAESATNVA